MISSLHTSLQAAQHSPADHALSMLVSLRFFTREDRAAEPRAVLRHTWIYSLPGVGRFKNWAHEWA
jgi:hypothetical protein